MNTQDLQAMDDYTSDAIDIVNEVFGYETVESFYKWTERVMTIARVLKKHHERKVNDVEGTNVFSG